LQCSAKATVCLII